MRGGSRPVSLTMTVRLILMLVAVFALQCINDVYWKMPAERWLALTAEGAQRGFAWQLLTFQFLHFDWLHVLFNLIGLWFFGQFVEQIVGWRRFLFAYFGCGVLGGFLQGLLMLLFPLQYGLVMYGASAGVAGMFAIFARLESESEVRWNFLIPVRARTLLWFYIAFELFFTLVPSGRGGGVAHAAHLGGILAGLGFVRLGWHHDFVPLPWVAWMTHRRASRRVVPMPRKLVVAGRNAPEDRGWVDPASSGDFMSREVDPILDKISAHGIQSLTPREREILEAARSTMTRR